MLPRADPRDKLIGAASFDTLPPNPIVGTSSPRRGAQVKRLRPDATITLFRGNVATRLAKLAAGEVHATLLAAAGLDRLDQGDVGTIIPVDTMLPAPSQGAVGIEILAGNAPVIEAVAAIDHRDTFDSVMMERAVLRGLGGTCHSPIAALALVDGDHVRIRAEIISPDGQETVSESLRLARDDLDAGEALGRALLDRASPALRALFEA
jgi:hydroxymethylbilane synthase